MKPPAPAPPKGFRPHMPIKVKLEAVLINGPVLDAEGNRVCSLEDINFDHQPPLMARVFDPEKWDTIPPANDPSHIVPLAKPVHGEKTAKVDIPQIAKTKRLANDHEEFRRKILSRECGEKRKPSGKITSRGFRKRPK
jgi:hypothetical protein